MFGQLKLSYISLILFLGLICQIFEDGINEPSVGSRMVSKWAVNRNYVLSPINGVLKYHRLGKQERNDPEIPFEKASLVLSDVSLTITEVQTFLRCILLCFMPSISFPKFMCYLFFFFLQAQYHDWIKLLEVFSRYKTYVEISHLRPEVTLSKNPRLWWRYAAQAVLQRKQMWYTHAILYTCLST